LIVDTSMFNRSKFTTVEMLYVALSRARSVEGLKITSKLTNNRLRHIRASELFEGLFAQTR
jgi:ATP-dependent exoDNAse (exonuclease V) alpha subunit